MKPGLYPDLNDEAYRDDEAVNQSKLKTGAIAWKKVEYEMIHGRKPPTPAMILGTRQHTAMLQPERMKDCVIQPESYPAPADHAQVKKGEIKEGDPLPWHNGAKVCKDWNRVNSVNGKIIIPSADMDSIRGMTESIWNNPDAATLLKLKGKRECAAFCEHEDTGLSLKAKFDLLPDKEPLIVDIKKTVSARLFDWERQSARLGYHIQAAFYTMVRDILMGQSTEGFFFIAVESEPPYLSQVYQIGEASIDKGRKEVSRLLFEYKACLESKSWPSYFSGVRQFDVPNYALSDQPDQDQLVYQLEG